MMERFEKPETYSSNKNLEKKSGDLFSRNESVREMTGKYFKLCFIPTQFFSTSKILCIAVYISLR